MEINIIHQLNSRYHSIISILQDTMQNEALVDRALAKVQAIRQHNGMVKHSLLSHSLSILSKKRSILAMTKTKKQLELLSILKSMHQTVQDLISTQSYQKASELIDHYQSVY